MKTIVDDYLYKEFFNHANHNMRGMREMINGQAVKILLYGDEKWYDGIVINAKKNWVQVNADQYGCELIADESNILDWQKVGM